MTEETGQLGIRVTPILGCIEAQGALVEGRGANNSTRWVFDVEGRCRDEPVIVRLLEHRWLRPITPALLSFSITPTSKAGAKALLWGQTKGGCLLLFAVAAELRVARDIIQVDHQAAFSCRVALDVMHTATR
jgi:hypothetical protein